MGNSCTAAKSVSTSKLPVANGGNQPNQPSKQKSNSQMTTRLPGIETEAVSVSNCSCFGKSIQSPKLQVPFFSASHQEEDNESKSRFNLKIKEALEKKRLEHASHPITFQRILLKFEKMQVALRDVKEVFHEVSKEESGLNLDGLLEAMKHLQVTMTKEEVADLFGFIDLDNSLKIEMKEFLVALTIGMVLDAIPALHVEQIESVKKRRSSRDLREIRKEVSVLEKKNVEIKEMLNLIVSAYLIFDPRGEGFILKDTVEKILEEHGSSGKNAMLSEAKWKEMDWDANGNIDFAEFVMSFSGWVDIDDAMED